MKNNALLPMKHVLKTDYDRLGLAFVIHRDLGGKWNNTLPYLRTRTHI